MLALTRRHHYEIRHDDSGVALVVVVVLMFLGALIASAIAMMIVTTAQSNVANRHRTQAFVTAESWRDAAVAGIAKGISDGDGTIPCLSGYTVSGATAANGATVRWAESATVPADWSPSIAGASGVTYTSCPTATSNWVVIHSIGTDATSKSEIDSVYVWSLQPDTRPAGTLAYFDGQFTATKSTYDGDLVIRGTDNYQCNNGAGHEINGDLWVTNASVDVTSDCFVTGSIYAYGYVSAKNNNLHVGGDIITQTGDIDLEQTGVIVGGQLYAGHNIILTKSGTVGHVGSAAECSALTPAQAAGCVIGGTAKAVGTVTSPIPSGWRNTSVSPSAPLIGQPGQPAPVITPTLRAVHDATAWLELDASKNLAQDSVVYPNATTPNVCTSAALTSILQTAGTRAFIDMSGCVSGNAVLVQPNATTVKRDALVYVPPTTGMSLKLTNTIANGNAALNSGNGPELLFVHGDSNVADGSPSCTQGSDHLAVSASIAVRTMLYSACGVSSTMALTMTGQLYMGTDGLHLNGGTFQCAAMGWDPAFKNLACGVKGDDGIFDPNKKTQLIGALNRQTEQ